MLLDFIFTLIALAIGAWAVLTGITVLLLPVYAWVRWLKPQRAETGQPGASNRR